MLLARRYRCDAVLCARRIFTERFEDNVLKPWARRTARLSAGAGDLRRGNEAEAHFGSMLAARTGLPPDAAKTRVDNVVGAYRDAVAKAQAAAETARRGAAKLSIYMCLSLIVGAFIASAAAALGGVHRDERPAKFRG
jgi:hypothetical protein